jgi:hypothetical protein
LIIHPIIANVFSIALVLDINPQMRNFNRFIILSLVSVMCLHTAGVFASLHAYTHQDNHKNLQSQCDHQENNDAPQDPKNPEHHDCPTCLTLAGTQLIAAIEPGTVILQIPLVSESVRLDFQCCIKHLLPRDRSPRAPPAC